MHNIECARCYYRSTKKFEITLFWRHEKNFTIGLYMCIMCLRILYFIKCRNFFFVSWFYNWPFIRQLWFRRVSLKNRLYVMSSWNFPLVQKFVGSRITLGCFSRIIELNSNNSRFIDTLNYMNCITTIKTQRIVSKLFNF